MRLKHSRRILGQKAQGIPTVPIATGSVKPMSKSATAKLVNKNEVRFSLFRWDQKMYTCTVKVLAVRMRSDWNAAILHITIAAVLAISLNHCTRYNSIFRLFFLAFEFSCLFNHLSQALMRPNSKRNPHLKSRCRLSWLQRPPSSLQSKPVLLERELQLPAQIPRYLRIFYHDIHRPSSASKITKHENVVLAPSSICYLLQNKSFR